MRWWCHFAFLAFFSSKNVQQETEEKKGDSLDQQRHHLHQQH
jgi:hypothetical protein